VPQGHELIKFVGTTTIVLSDIAVVTQNTEPFRVAVSLEPGVQIISPDFRWMSYSSPASNVVQRQENLVCNLTACTDITTICLECCILIALSIQACCFTPLWAAAVSFSSVQDIFTELRIILITLTKIFPYLCVLTFVTLSLPEQALEWIGLSPGLSRSSGAGLASVSIPQVIVPTLMELFKWLFLFAYPAGSCHTQ
jgi:hypothetical protein